MGLFEDIKAKAPPEVLYHYTSQDGLLGIVHSGVLWASKIQFLNDSSELTFGRDAVRYELTQAAASATPPRKQLLVFAAAALDRIERVNLCIACFCEQRNLLSQWRAYSRNTVGYSIGLEAACLKNLASRQGFFLAPCVYLHTDQQALLREAISLVLPAFDNAFEGRSKGDKKDEEVYEVFTWKLLNRILERLPLIKNPAFSEEKEWRLVSPLISNLDDRFGVHPARSCLVPHFEFSLRDQTGELSFDEVVVGPNSLGQGSLEGVGLLLNRYKAKVRRLAMTNIPYREL